MTKTITMNILSILHATFQQQKQQQILECWTVVLLLDMMSKTQLNDNSVASIKNCNRFLPNIITSTNIGPTSSLKPPEADHGVGFELGGKKYDSESTLKTISLFSKFLVQLPKHPTRIQNHNHNSCYSKKDMTPIAIYPFLTKLLTWDMTKAITMRVPSSKHANFKHQTQQQFWESWTVWVQLDTMSKTWW